MNTLKIAIVLAILCMVRALGAQESPNNFPAPTPATIYVSAEDGNDTWTGAYPYPMGTDGPLKTFNAARMAVQALNKSLYSSIHVRFRKGTYYLPATVNFTNLDSGTASTEIFYENYPNEAPAISGGMRVGNWTHSGGSLWQASLPASTLYFENLFYNGVRRLRPRLGLPVAAFPLGVYFRVYGTVYVSDEDAKLPQNANCAVKIKDNQWECFDRFIYSDPNMPSPVPISSQWKNLNAGTTPSNPNCDPSNGSTAPVGDIELLIFEQFSTSKLPISCIDTTNRVVYLTAPTAFSATKPTESGFIVSNRYLIENVEDEFTQDGGGIWFLDRSSSPNWTLKYEALDGEDPNTSTVVVPQLKQLIVASDLQYVTFKGLTFEADNYTVWPQGHASTEMEPDISAALSFQNSSHITFDSDTVRRTSGTGTDFISCITDPNHGTDPSTRPVAECVSTLSAPSVAKNVIENSAFYDIGVLGLRIGDPYLSTDEEDYVPEDTTVENNVVVGYGRTIPASFGIAQGEGHDNLYTHNEVYDGYHCAISISEQLTSGAPNGVGNARNTISFNHVHNLLQGIMNDGGSIRIQSGNDYYTAPGNKILNNWIHDVTDASIVDANGYGGHGIYMDDQTGLVDVENNLVYRVSAAAVYTPHGPAKPNQANLIKNNILAYGRLGMIEEGDPYPYYPNDIPTSSGDVPRSFKVVSNLFYFDRSLASSPAFSAIAGCSWTPFAYPLFQLFESNLYWRTDGSFASDGMAFSVQKQEDTTSSKPPCAPGPAYDPTWYDFYTFKQWKTEVHEDEGSIVANPNFKNPAYPHDDYSLPDGSPGVSFSPFLPDGAGRYPSSSLIMPPAIRATFVTEKFNPATDY